MFGHGRPAGTAMRYTPLFENHTACPTASGGGKTMDNTNITLREEMGVRCKFGRLILTAPTCFLPDEFFACRSLAEVFQLCRNTEASATRFNPYWLVMIDFLWGRKSTRNKMEIYTKYTDLEDRLEELCQVDRDDDDQQKKFHRPHGEKKTVSFSDDGDFASKDSFFADGRLKDMNHPNRENTIQVCAHGFHTHAKLTMICLYTGVLESRVSCSTREQHRDGNSSQNTVRRGSYSPSVNRRFLGQGTEVSYPWCSE